MRRAPTGEPPKRTNGRDVLADEPDGREHEKESVPSGADV